MQSMIMRNAFHTARSRLLIMYEMSGEVHGVHGLQCQIGNWTWNNMNEILSMYRGQIYHNSAHITAVGQFQW